MSSKPFSMNLNAGAQLFPIFNSATTLLPFSSLCLILLINYLIPHKALNGADGHTTTLSLLKLVSSYSRDSKVVLIMLAFSLNYGELCLIAKFQSTNPFAKSIAMLKQVPTIWQHAHASSNPIFDAIKLAIRVMRDVTMCVVKAGGLSFRVPAFSTIEDLIPRAIYWTIRSVMACATALALLNTTDHTEELSTLADQNQHIHDLLRKQLTICYQEIDEKKYEMLLGLFRSIHMDNINTLKALFNCNTIYDCRTQTQVGLDVLRKKNVLLLISGLDISNNQDELSILEQIYSESLLYRPKTRDGGHPYELVWVPVMDPTVEWNDSMQKQFEELRHTMPWFTVISPALLGRVVIRFIREVWHFKNKPILVVLDPQGSVVCPNAQHMMWIWGSNAFPFTTLREEALWREEMWRLEILIDGIDPIIFNWIREEKYIFLYGGDDIEWVRKFTKMARTVSEAAGIAIEMVYLGKSYKRNKVRGVISTIMEEKLCHYWEMIMIWFFWTRLHSMLLSKIQLGKIDEYDPLMREIKKLLSYDKAGGWALLCKGFNIFVNGHSSTVMRTLTEFQKWREQVLEKGFDWAFKEYHDNLLQDADEPCCRFEFPSTIGEIPENLKCPECDNTMEKHIAFRCCHD
ncbi:protein SIEVE ELEMENT OCCLUSION B-like isoform X3 [Mercurialis annua]|uniref:protein SIEVE ELEMENT OCCLUSION B-like isoform X3 n=1 Tax=Mercurialis annua TaxID=3986 RepID=UPI0024ADDBCB|nr:protein SIEVE ELEMENT OCCLUSION B-like isoform X3 [Mercurialis annua]